MPETKHILVELSSLPVSVIIVGVGKANFSNMICLDSDNYMLEDSHGKKAVRDIVQFVVFNEAMKKGDLAEQVLHEVPNQFIGYMKMSNAAKPRPQLQEIH